MPKPTKKSKLIPAKIVSDSPIRIKNSFLRGVLFGLGIGIGLAIVSFGVYLVLAAVPGTVNPTAAPPGDDVSWNPLHVDPVNNRVGIGTQNPGYSLDVSGIINATDIYKNGSPFSPSQWTTSGANIYYNGGNVGVGTTNPSAKFEVAGGWLQIGETNATGSAYGISFTKNVNFGGSTKGNTTHYIFGPYNSASGDPGALYIAAGQSANGTNNDIILYKYGGGNVPTIRLDADNVNIAGNLSVSGAKNFEIDHPTKPGMKLVHSSLEGPEAAVFYRGESHLINGKTTITLPDYFEALTRKEGRTVLLTPEFDSEEPISLLAASEVKNGKFSVKAVDYKNPNQKFYWEVKAVRADIPLIDVEKIINK